MAGLWETLPASPCSAASDDTAMRSARESAKGPSAPSKLTLPPLPPVPAPRAMKVSVDTCPVSPPIAKRARLEDVPPASRSGSIEFVEAKTSSSERNADLVARLNSNASATDERRKALLQRLAVIGSQKAALSSRSSASLDDEVTVVQEKITSPPAPAPRASRKRKSAAPPRKKSPRENKPAKPASPTVIDVDDESAVASIAQSSSRVSKGKTAVAPASSALVKRTSSRVRRPRTPNVLLDSTVDKKCAPMPSCMSKCKRLQFCKKLVTSMLRDSSAAPFSAPVNELWHEQAIPRYFEVITHPMDLRTVKKNLETSVYIYPTKGDYLPYRFDVDKFADDVRLVYRNAMVYNRAGDMLYNCAHSLLEDFEKTMLEELPSPPSAEEIAQSLPKKRNSGTRSRKDKNGDGGARSRPSDVEVVSLSDDVDSQQLASAPTRSRKSKVSSPAPAEASESTELDDMSVKDLKERLRYLQRCRTPVIARTPVPKGSGYLTRAALLYDVDMTWQEKKKCSQFIQKVPASKIEVLIDMIKKSSHVDDQQPSEEFEFDMDNLDNKTMRNIEAFLEQFAPGFKTVRSSTLGREFSTAEEVDAEMKSIRERLAKRPKVQKEATTQLAEKPKSFFESQDMHDSSSDSSSGEESDEGSDSSDDSDSDSE